MGTKIRVAFVADGIERPAMGTARYAQRLIETMLLRHADEVELTLIHRKSSSHPLYQKTREIILPEVNLPKLSTSISHLIWALQRHKEKFNIIHFYRPNLHPTFPTAKRVAKKIVITFHGAAERPDIPSSINFERRIQEWCVSLFQYWIDAGIADSQTAQEAVARYYRIPQEKIHAIYNGVELAAPSIPQVESARKLEKKYRISTPFILSVARFDPHKNILGLIRAFDRFKRSSALPHRLILVGGRHTQQYAEEAETLLSKLGRWDTTMIAPYIEETDLPHLYAAADLLVFPSFSEGFGFPILEAMRCGTPVITSNISAMPEIAGGAAYLVDPYRPDEIAEAMVAVLTNPRLQATLRKRGYERSKGFTWEACAAKTVALYKELLGKS